MTVLNATKINQLLSSHPKGVVLLTAWLAKRGYSLSLQQEYRNSHWFESIGRGAMIRSGDSVDYKGAIYALQGQAGLSVHPGGRTALSLLGKAHYLELAPTKVVLFGAAGQNLPSWFKNYGWGVKFEYHKTSFLPPEIGMTEVSFGSYSIKVSGAARALMECVYLAPNKQDLIECYELMEGLNTLRPEQVQQLLEQCKYVKVKRLFLYLAKKSGHAWFNHLNLKTIDLGSGKRSVVKNGVYDSTYQITIPKELARKGP